MKHDTKILVKNVAVIWNNNYVAETPDIFFVNVVCNLDITFNEDLINKTDDVGDHVENIINQYKIHPSIKIIREQNG